MKKIIFSTILYSIFLFHQIKSSDLDEMNKILKNPNRLLLLAANRGQQNNLVPCILNPDVDINFQVNSSYELFLPEIKSGSTALHIAISSLCKDYMGETADRNGGDWINLLNLFDKNIHFPPNIDESNSKNRYQAVQILLHRQDINLNLQDSDGNTPLLLAAKCYYIGRVRFAIIRLLLERNADITIKNNEGKSFLDYIAAEPTIKNIYELNNISNAIKENINNIPNHVVNIIKEYAI